MNPLKWKRLVSGTYQVGTIGRIIYIIFALENPLMEKGYTMNTIENRECILKVAD